MSVESYGEVLMSILYRIEMYTALAGQSDSEYGQSPVIEEDLCNPYALSSLCRRTVDHFTGTSADSVA